MLTKFCAITVLLAQASTLAALSEMGAHVDREWFSRALAEEAAHWRESAFRNNGFFAVFLDRQWRPVGSQNGTLVTQSRQIFVMVAGYEHTRDRAYLDAVKRGAEFLLRHFRDPEHGLFFYSTTQEGRVIDDRKDSYGLAFTIFALSHAARITKEKRYRQAALETWAEMKRNLRDATGFIKPRTDRTYTRTIGENTQNPMMHLFEALLALYDATGSNEVFQDARQLADAIFAKLFDAQEGRLPELFDASWKPAPPEKPGYLELGHQFEWAFLLSHAVEKGFPKEYLAIGERLLDYGMKMAYDREEGGFFSRLDSQGAVIRGQKSWWEQCEALRALMHYAVLRGRSDLWPAFDKSFEFVKMRFIDPEYGGWYAYCNPRSATQRTNKGSAWQVGYHVCGLYREALRLGAVSGQPSLPFQVFHRR